MAPGVELSITVEESNVVIMRQTISPTILRDHLPFNRLYVS
jgi:hypothetical protein